MKRKCKRVCIWDRNLVEAAVRKCLAKSATRCRRDTIAYFSSISGLNSDLVAEVLKKRYFYYDTLISMAVDMLVEELKSGDIKLPPVHYKEKRDGSSGKVRTISVLHIKELMVDHVAVMAMSELQRRLGRYQYSGLPGRGTTNGLHVIQKWMLDRKACRYAVKMDIRKFYQSIDKERLMEWFDRHVCNKPLQTLVRRLVGTCRAGIHIGSYLSQTLSMLYLSDLYHFASSLHTKRGARSCSHVFFYADDILLLGPNRRELLRTASLVSCYASDKLGVHIKEQWDIPFPGTPFLDMLGYRIYPGGMVSIRKRIYRRIRRTAVRLYAGSRCDSHLRRAVTYNGWMSHSTVVPTVYWTFCVDYARKTLGSLEKNKRVS